jgi:glycosyltransferase involved in cell wall biosynthesis
MVMIDSEVLGKQKLPTSMKNKKLSILLLTWEFPPHIVGGLSRHSEGLAVSLNKLGADVNVITARPKFETKMFEEWKGVNVHRVEPLNFMDSHFLHWIAGLNLKMTEKVMELSKKNKFHVIHAHDWLVGEAAVTLAKFLNLPLITTIHATEYGRNSGIFTELQQFIHNKENELIHSSNHVIVCSDYMKDEVCGLFSVEEKKISVIPNGVHKEEHTNEEQALHPILANETRNIIFTLGRFVKEKGFDLIIEAAKTLKHKNLCFVIAGKGPMLQEYQQLIEKYHLEDSVFLPGFISEQHRIQFFKRCTMAIFPSRYEPFGIVALEALKFAKPLIVSETGGLKSINKHMDTGLFMESENVSSLVQQIEYVLSFSDHAEQMAENGKRLVESYYSWHRVAELTKRHYEDQSILFSINEEIRV